MGVIKPPWVDRYWFARCPFNYCDHFGDKEVLATMCKICKDELLREDFYRKIGKDPHDLENVFNDLGDNLVHAMYLVRKKAIEMGIDIDNVENVEEASEPDSELLFQ